MTITYLLTSKWHEVDGEDFALPTFVCPSKVEMTEIIRQGLKDHAAEVLE